MGRPSRGIGRARRVAELSASLWKGPSGGARNQSLRPAMLVSKFHVEDHRPCSQICDFIASPKSFPLAYP